MGRAIREVEWGGRGRRSGGRLSSHGEKDWRPGHGMIV